VKTRDLAREMADAVAALQPRHLDELDRHGLDLLDIVVIPQLVGRADVKIEGERYQPDPHGSGAFITPVCIHEPHWPESPYPLEFVRYGNLVDLVAWHPRFPDRWATRTGTASWLGLREVFDPFPVPVWRGVLGWLRAGAVGIVLLTSDRAERWRLLSDLPGIIAEDEEHATELRNALQRPWSAPPVIARRSSVTRHAA